ncbi:hypothetical protein DIPPA_63731 [Diplonema papillatum]|nr:hypothetical protein DIPPA_63731 [Diplonema papillatum]
MPISLGTAPGGVPVPATFYVNDEVVAGVSFDEGEHGAQMKVTMVEGNTAASVIAYCCAALNDRLHLHLLNTSYILEVNLDGSAPTAGYLFGLSHVLSHPDVRKVLDDGQPLLFSLKKLPKDHPNGMYVETARAEGRPIGSGESGDVRGTEFHLLEQAIRAEAEREMSLLDWARPPAAVAQYATSPMHAVESARGRILHARDVMRMSQSAMSHAAIRDVLDSGQRLEITDDKSATLPNMTGNDASSEWREESMSQTHGTPLQRVQPAYPPSRAAEGLRQQCAALQDTLSQVKVDLKRETETGEALRSELITTEDQRDQFKAELGQARQTIRRLEERNDSLEADAQQVSVLRQEIARLQQQLQQSHERERSVSDEVLRLQREIAREVTCLPLPQTPPPVCSPRISAPIVVGPTPKVTFTDKYSRANRRKEELSNMPPSPGTPEVVINSTDTFGEIVAKLTGNAPLGEQVDKSLNSQPLWSVSHEDDEVREEVHHSEFSPKQMVHERLNHLAKDLHSSARREAASSDGGISLGEKPTKRVPATRQHMLQQVADLRHLLSSIPPTPDSGPGSPGGPLRSTSAYTYASSLPNLPPPPPPPPAPRSAASTPSLTFAGTRPPGC